MMRKVVVNIATFILIYVPIIFGVNLLHALTIVAMIYLFLHLKKTLEILQIRDIFVLVTMIMSLIIYLFFVIRLNRVPLTSITPHIYMLLEVIPVSIMIVLINRNQSDVKILNVILNVAIVQSLIAFASYLVPNLQQFLVRQLVNQGATEVYLRIADYRMYGFSNFLTFATPALQAIIAFLMMLKIKNKEYKYLLFLPFIIFSSLINARTSVVVLVIGLLMIVLFGLTKGLSKIVVSSLLLTIILIFIFSNNIQIAIVSDNPTIQWIVTGLNEIVSFLNGNVESGYFAYVTSANQYQLPEGAGLLFGEGIRVMFGNSSNFLSDIGYINDIWLGGLIYLVAISLIISFLFISGKNASSYLGKEDIKLTSIFLITILIVLNFKGFIFGFNPVINTTLLLYINLIFEFYIKKKSNNLGKS
ncbi:hypothetical protein [Aerococcus urinaeequi]|uniref:Uncharacterized protein n=1 Tax=Aerococcus urinaeequi TaxID=51665 RepID=A0AAC9F3Q3_9LACT|nr:hypothetical protein [Aerococcus urinaeequi]AMB97021.1 hypothetical protein AWM74_01685 [Aerococcus urinaeequi]